VAGSGGPIHSRIDFARLTAALLDRAHVLVPQWLPGGTQRGKEYVCADLSGGQGSSCSVNVATGRWADFASDDCGADLVALYAAVEGLDQAQAARALIDELGLGDCLVEVARRVRAPSSSAGGAAEPPPALPEEAYAAGVGDGGRHKVADPKPRRERRWKPIVPVPAHALEPTFKHFDRPDSARTHTWEYSFEGRRYGYVVRFRTSDGGKDTLPYTWCTDELDPQGTQRWAWKTWEEPRPLYVPATLLAADPRLVPVCLVEGEKCALAGHELLGHEFDFVSWPGGGKAWPRADWAWLRGRVVYLWPDCDAQRFALTKVEREAKVDPGTKEIMPAARQPGMRAMVGIGSLLAAEHGCTVCMVQIPQPGQAPTDGWDIADAIEQGWDAARVRDFIRAAVPFVAPDDAVRAKAAPTPTRASAGEEGGAPDAPASNAWRAHLLLSVTTGAVKAVRENVTLVLDGWAEKGVPGAVECAGLIRHNEFSNNIDKMRATPWGTPAGEWSEADELMMGDWLVRTFGLPSMARAVLEEAVIVVARRHAYHPVRERMEGLRGRWDGTPRLDTWLARCYLVEDEFDEREPLYEYLAKAGAWFVMAMVARVLSPVMLGRQQYCGPGVKFDYMLVLEGPTDWGKSTSAAILGGEYFADTGLDVSNKDSLMNIQGIHVYEWPELDGFVAQDLTAIKRFIASPCDRFRATFDRRPAKYPRQVVFVGTTEEAHYLKDLQGNRRFWPVRLTREPDNEWLRDNLEQMFAEAVVRLDARERFWPVKGERDLFRAQQMTRAIESSLGSAIKRFLYDGHPNNPIGAPGNELDGIMVMDLLQILQFPIEKQTYALVRQATAVLSSMGWAPRKAKRDETPAEARLRDRRPLMWMRPDDVDGRDGRNDRDSPSGGSPGSGRPSSDEMSPPGTNHGEDPEAPCPF
jgi:predicted P-loop ATPase